MLTFFRVQSCVFEPTPVHKSANAFGVDNESQGRHGFYCLAESLHLVLQLVNTHLITGPEQREESEHVKPSETDRLVPGGRDVEVQMRSLRYSRLRRYSRLLLENGTGRDQAGKKNFATNPHVVSLYVEI
jgi:hypothetical protein